MIMMSTSNVYVLVQGTRHHIHMTYNCMCNAVIISLTRNITTHWSNWPFRCVPFCFQSHSLLTMLIGIDLDKIRKNEN